VVDNKGGIETKYATDVWFEWDQRPTFEGLCFEPDEWKVKTLQYNLWKGFDMRSKRGGSWSLLRAHVLDNLCGGDDYTYAWVMTWCAQLVQFPGKKPGTALVFRGAKGVGKSFFAQQLGELVKLYFMVLSSTHDIVGQFNDHLAGRLLILGDEGIWGGNKRDDGALKNLVTSQNIAIEKKHFSKVAMSNYTRFIFCSNEKWVVPSSWDRERRFLVLDVSAAYQNDYHYFGAIVEQLEAGGYEAWMHDLMRWEPVDGDWRVLQSAPQTAATDTQKVLGADLATRFLIEVIEKGGFGAVSEFGMAHWAELNLDRPNIVAHQALLRAFRMLAERDGKEKSVRPKSNEIIGLVTDNPAVKYDDNKPVECVVFPGLREIVPTHRAAGRYGFDPVWEDEEAGAA
jgi:hypothetical protein